MRRIIASSNPPTATACTRTLTGREEQLEDVVEDTVKAGGTLMIPTFAMERTQELLYHLHQLFEGGRIPRVPVFIDSPLAIKLTAVYKKYESYFNAETQHIAKSGEDILNFPGLRLTLTTEQSKEINDVPPPKIVIAGSGMSNGGRILHHEQRYLPDPKSTILFIGYQAKGTLGRADYGRREGGAHLWRKGARAMQEGEHPRLFRACGPAAAPRMAHAHAPFAQKGIRGAGRGTVKRAPLRGRSWTILPSKPKCRNRAKP